MSKDPLTLVYEGLWELVEDFKPFADEVRVGNRIKMSGKSRDPEKEYVTTADLPQVKLVPSGGETNLHSSSNQTQMIRRFSFIIDTGDKRVDYLHFPLQWHIVCVMCNWKMRIGGMKWNGHHFLTDLQIPSVEEGESDPDANDDIEGFTSIATIEATMLFATHLLRKS